MTDPRRVAVVGLGVGRMHVRAYRRLRDRFTVAAVCDINEAVAGDVANRIDADVASFDEILARDDIDIVNLCTPPSFHREQLLAVLEAGKLAVCEKPLVASLSAVDEIAKAEAGSRGRVMPIFQYRFGTGLQQLRALVEAGITGDAYTASVELAWRRRDDYYAVPWRGRWESELGGVLLSHAIHLLDMLTYIAGPVSRVFCRVATRVNNIEVDDCASASLELSNGGFASVTATLGSPEEISRHRFHFANLSAESGTEPYNSSSAPWRITPDTPEVERQIDEILRAHLPGREAWEGQFEAMADALEAGAELPVRLADARQAIELITAFYASARSNTDISLPLATDHPLYRGWLP